MSKLVANYNGGTSDEYGTFAALNRLLSGDVIEGFNVVPNGTPNMTVLVNPGSGRVSTGTYPSSYGYLISHDTGAGESVTIATAAASPRIDYILAYVDKSVAGSILGANVNNTNNVLKFASVAGTPSGSPVVPTLSQIQTAIGAANPYILLAQVAVGASVSSITSPNITDIRTIAKIANAWAPFDYIGSGLVWSGDSYGASLNGSMSAGLVYIGGVPVTLTAISGHAFAPSKDTYIDVDRNGNVTYNPQTNNAASPALAANSVRLAIVITGASNIAAAGSVNQGQETSILPLISGVPIAVCDSLGNLISPRDPMRRVIGVRRRATSVGPITSATVAQVTELSCPIIVPTGRKYKARLFVTQMLNDTSAGYAETSIWEGTVGSGVEIAAASGRMGVASMDTSGNCDSPPRTPSSSNVTVNVGVRNPGAAGNASFIATLGSGIPITLIVELS